MGEFVNLSAREGGEGGSYRDNPANFTDLEWNDTISEMFEAMRQAAPSG